VPGGFGFTLFRDPVDAMGERAEASEKRDHETDQDGGSTGQMTDHADDGHLAMNWRLELAGEVCLAHLPPRCGARA